MLPSGLELLLESGNLFAQFRFQSLGRGDIAKVITTPPIG